MYLQRDWDSFENQTAPLSLLKHSQQWRFIKDLCCISVCSSELVHSEKPKALFSPLHSETTQEIHNEDRIQRERGRFVLRIEAESFCRRDAVVDMQKRKGTN